MRPARFLAAALAVLQLQGCIHVRSRESVLVPNPKTESRSSAEVRQVGPFEVSSIVYRPSEFPLESFFTRLAHGEFEDAFRKIDFWYRPSNADNAALEVLLDNGFVPVLVSVINTGVDELPLKRLRLRLKSARRSVKPIPNNKLPKAFKRVNWPAVTANVHNTAMVVLGTAAVLVALVGAAYIGGVMEPSMFEGWGNRPKKESKVFNPTTMLSDIEYGDYLLQPHPLAGGERTSGLLFFKMKSGFVDWQQLRLSASLR